MSDPKPTDPVGTPAKTPFFKRLFTWRNARRCLIGLAVLLTLFALFHAEENWRGERAWRKYRAEMESKGAVFDLKALVPPPVPDDQNFAMTPLLKPLLDLNPVGSPERFRDTNGVARIEAITDLDQQALQKVDHPGNNTVPWLSGNRNDLGRWQTYFQASTNFPQVPVAASPAEAVIKALSRFDAEFAELRAASKLPHSRFNVAYGEDNPMGILLPHLARVKGLVRLTALRTEALLALGRPSEALEEVEFMFRLTDSVKDEPLLISYLVRNACREIILRTLWEGLQDHRWQPAQLTALQARLADIHSFPDLRQALIAERAMASTSIEWLMRNPSRMIDLEESWSPSPEAEFVFALIPKGWFRFEQINYNKSFETYILEPFPQTQTAIDLPGLQRRENAYEEHLDETRSPRKAILEHHVLNRTWLSSMSRIHHRAIRSHTLIHLARVALALEAYRQSKGTFPDSLEKLAPEFIAAIPSDPLDRKPLRYEKSADGTFKLWSVGWNGKDDGGKPVQDSAGPRGYWNSDYPNADWVWPQPGKKGG